MSKFGNQSFQNKFLNALNGFYIQYTKQVSAKRQICISIFFILVAIYLKFSLQEYCMLSLIITIIFLAEFINSTIEYMQDELFGENYSEVAKTSKDMAAGIVLFAIMMAFVSGSFLYLPKIVNLFYQ